MADESGWRRVVFVYLTANALFTLAASVIWAINTLFLMGAGLDIFQVMIVNSAFTVGQLVFEVPTGVIADTIGRRASYLIGIGSLLVATLGYVGSAEYGWGIWAFIGASIVLGFGFTCQTGAVDAWLVDALAVTDFSGAMERVFAWGGMVFGVATLVGTVLGGVLGQVNLALPYLLRSGLLAVAFVFVLALMRDRGFEPRPLRVSTFGAETRRIFDAGVRYGWRHRVVRPLMFVSFVQGTFTLFAFYSWQRYALDLLGRELVWVSGVLVASFSVASILGNALVGRVMRSGELRRRPAFVLAWVTLLFALLSFASGLVGVLAPSPGVAPLVAAAGLFVVSGVLMGVSMPVRQAFLNEQIPSAQRATVLSLDSFFADAGGAVGQPVLGYVAKAVSIPVALMVGSAISSVGWPLYRAAGRACDEGECGPPAE